MGNSDMQIGEFVLAHRTTKDTVRFYVQEGLMHPRRLGRNFCYVQKDGEDFEQIKSLQDMGFSISAIKEIYDRHERQCGTAEQWKANLALVRREIAAIEEQEAVLRRRKLLLGNLQEQLQELLGAGEEGV